MSIVDSIKNKFILKTSAKDFYSNFEIVETEWWFSWCHEYPNLFWARLRKFSNGKADVLFQDEYKSYGFDSEKSASNFIAEDEFSKFKNLDREDRNDLEIPTDFVIKIPDWEIKEVNDFEYIGTY